MKYIIKELISIETSKYQIKQISAEDTYDVRHPVLRSGKPIETCIFKGDNLETTIHLGIYYNGSIIGVCSFFYNSHKDISESNQYQLRGMAILKKYQGKGTGKTILSYGENLLKQKNINLIWCNAREVAVNFYKRNGYRTIGKSFNITDIGLHYVMSKPI
ncbi:GNAT family N-acetyltransferase [Tamlana sp. 2201CG12-4]|uniref:GNAT family N-acetyltransferase n=1 Tax=Tamlana sp. 2201CG12-4 TaxID=3112582 RepID=UPI002DBBBC92|nr:GNAT family N-acetyltransferase [Tamlana sp. 2201CG12-4]MEC3905491.1 GNAT family N-acetyltransferase [Tamlana sp. 2201CG12-4]